MRSIIILCLIGIATATLSTGSDKSIETPCPPKVVFGENDADDCCGSVSSCTKDATSRIVSDKDIGKYDEFIKYTNEYLVRSFEYFFLSAQFGTYIKDRPGFEKLLHGLSDNAWNKGIEMIKEITKRGFAHKFELSSEVQAIKSTGNVTELVALAKATQIEKGLLLNANDIHRHHSHASFEASKSCGYDAGLSHYIVEEIVMEKTDTVRKLTGLTNQLKKLFAQDPKVYPLSLFMFDQHLQ